MIEKQSQITTSINTDTIINHSEPKALMTQHEAAQYLGTSVGVLNVWRHLGKQKIPFVRWGRHIRYRKTDLDAWIESNVENKRA